MLAPGVTITHYEDDMRGAEGWTNPMIPDFATSQDPLLVHGWYGPLPVSDLPTLGVSGLPSIEKLFVHTEFFVDTPGSGIQAKMAVSRVITGLVDNFIEFDDQSGGGWTIDDSGEDCSASDPCSVDLLGSLQVKCSVGAHDCIPAGWNQGANPSEGHPDEEDSSAIYRIRFGESSSSSSAGSWAFGPVTVSYTLQRPGSLRSSGRLPVLPLDIDDPAAENGWHMYGNAMATVSDKTSMPKSQLDAEALHGPFGPDIKKVAKRYTDLPDHSAMRLHFRFWVLGKTTLWWNMEGDDKGGKVWDGSTVTDDAIQIILDNRTVVTYTPDTANCEETVVGSQARTYSSDADTTSNGGDPTLFDAHFEQGDSCVIDEVIDLTHYFSTAELVFNIVSGRVNPKWAISRYALELVVASNPPKFTDEHVLQLRGASFAAMKIPNGLLENIEAELTFHYRASRQVHLTGIGFITDLDVSQGTAESLQAPEPTRNMHPVEFPLGVFQKSERTCAELEGAFYYGKEPDAVCASQTNGEGYCIGKRKHQEALDVCITQGARLCTASELLRGCAADFGEGCAEDELLTNHTEVTRFPNGTVRHHTDWINTTTTVKLPTWSSTRCTMPDGFTDGYFAFYGEGGTDMSVEAGIQYHCQETQKKLPVRCCADVVSTKSCALLEEEDSRWVAENYKESIEQQEDTDRMVQEKDSHLTCSLYDGSCSAAKTYADASSECKSIGARLCTEQEVFAGEVAFDHTQDALCAGGFWTSTACKDSHGVEGKLSWRLQVDKEDAVPGEEHLDVIPARAFCIPESSTISYKCCADVDVPTTQTGLFYTLKGSALTMGSTTYTKADGSEEWMRYRIPMKEIAEYAGENGFTHLVFSSFGFESDWSTALSEFQNVAVKTNDFADHEASKPTLDWLAEGDCAAHQGVIKTSWEYREPELLAQRFGGQCIYQNGQIKNSLGQEFAYNAEAADVDRRVLEENVNCHTNGNCMRNFDDEESEVVLGNRRVYCITPHWGSFGWGKGNCASGLYYTGVPVDVRAHATWRGVVFQFQDTSGEDLSFEVVREDVGKPEPVTIVVYPESLYGCARRLETSLTYTDKYAARLPNRKFTYAISAMLENPGANDNPELRNPNNMIPMTTRIEYTIPWMGRIQGEILTEGRSGVRGVTVSVCHKIGANVPYSGKSPCWKQITDQHGGFEIQIKVNSIEEVWREQAQHFEVVPHLFKYSVLHIFEPDMELVECSHGYPEVLAFEDQSSYTISGQINFANHNNIKQANGWDEVDFSSCFLPGVKINVLEWSPIIDEWNSEPISVTTDEFGRWNISAPAGAMIKVNADFEDHEFFWALTKSCNDLDNAAEKSKATWLREVCECTPSLVGGDERCVDTGEVIIQDIFNAVQVDFQDHTKRRVRAVLSVNPNVTDPGMGAELKTQIDSYFDGFYTPVDETGEPTADGTIVLTAWEYLAPDCLEEVFIFAGGSPSRPVKDHDTFKGEHTFSNMDDFIELPAMRYEATLIKAPDVAATPGNTEVCTHPELPVEYFEKRETSMRIIDLTGEHNATTEIWEYHARMCYDLAEYDLGGYMHCENDCNRRCTSTCDSSGVCLYSYDQLDTCAVVEPLAEGHNLRFEIDTYEKFSFLPEGDPEPITGNWHIPYKELRIREDLSTNFETGEGACELEWCRQFGNVTEYDLLIGDPKKGGTGNKKMELEIVHWDPATLSPIKFFFIPITGEYPQTLYPESVVVPTESNMIFMILRDPPGGASKSSLAEDVSLSMDFTSSNPSTDEEESGDEFEKDFGPALELQIDIAPLGFGLLLPSIALSASVDAKLTPQIKKGSGATSSAGSTLNLNVGSGLATSTDPASAGTASDLILGGGLEIEFRTTIMTVWNEDSTCLLTLESIEWLPARLTTYFMQLQDIITEYDELNDKRITALNFCEALGLTGNPCSEQEEIDQINIKLEVEKKMKAWAQTLHTYAQATQSEGPFIVGSTKYKKSLAAAKGTAKSIEDNSINNQDEGALDSVEGTKDEAEVGGESDAGDSGDFKVGKKDKDDDEGEEEAADAQKKMKGGSGDDGAKTSEDDLDNAARDTTELPDDMKSEPEDRDHFLTEQLGNAGASAIDPYDSEYDDDYGMGVLRAAVGVGAVASGPAGIAATAANGGVDDTARAAKKALGISHPFNSALLRTHFQAVNLGDDGKLQNPGAGNFYAGAREGVGENTTDYSTTKQSPFMGLEDGKTLISFSGGGQALEFSHSSYASVSLSQGTNVDWNLEMQWEWNYNFEFTKPVKFKFGQSGDGVHEDEFVLSHEEDHGRARAFSVTVTLADPDNGDHFYLTVHTDSAFGTPIFNLAGGLTSCPGEPGTNWAEDYVWLSEIAPRCKYMQKGEVPAGQEDYECKNLAQGQIAEFALSFIVGDAGPDIATGFLLVATAFHDSTLQECGDAGRTGGLIIMVRGEALGTKAFDLEYLPSGTSEMIINVDTVSPCLEYNEVELAAVSACEFGMRGGISMMSPMDPDSFDPNFDLGEDPDAVVEVPDFSGYKRVDAIGLQPDQIQSAYSGPKTFSVSWSAIESRRLGTTQSEPAQVLDVVERQLHGLQAKNNELSAAFDAYQEKYDSLFRTRMLYVFGTLLVVNVLIKAVWIALAKKKPNQAQI